MFTTICSTCEAKLIVKNEELVGKIVACPNCGGMVFVQLPDDVSTQQVEKSPKKVVHKRFPDVLSHGTASGVIGQVPDENRRTGILLEADSDTSVSVAEIKARKILVGIFLGLLGFLLLALGFLMLARKLEELPPPQPPRPNVEVPVEPPPIEPPHVEPDPTKVDRDDIDDGHSAHNEEPAEMAIQENVSNEPFLITGSTSFVLGERTSDMIESSVPNIDIPEKLSLPIHEINLDQHSLIEFVRVLSRLTGIPMTLDIDEMKPLSLSVKTPVSGQFKEATVEQILSETLAAVGLHWKATDQQILIQPKMVSIDSDNVELTFDVSDFVEKTNDLKADVLAEIVQRLVCPDENVVVLPDHRLTIEQGKNNRKSLLRQSEDIRRFLEQLRFVRQLPQNSELKAETLAPEAFGWDRVMEPMTLNYYLPVPLSQVVAQLETRTKLTIIVDHQSLHRAWCPFVSIWATVQCNQGTVNDVLELSFASVESVALAYRIIDHQTLEITTAESAGQPEKMVVEVHPYQLGEDETPEDIVRSLRLAVKPESWATTFLEGQGDIVVDQPSGCLFVRQSQPAQRQIRFYLSEPKPLAP